MSYVSKKDFGWSRRYGWLNGDEESYKRLVDLKTRAKCAPGRDRKYPPHPSWKPYLELFDHTNQERSQGAFCRWAGINRASFSAAKNKRITVAMEEKLSQWIEELQIQGNEI